MHTEAHAIKRILNRSGETIYTAEVKPKRVLDSDSSAIATWMLRNVVQAGTGGAAGLADRPVAGKTGTSDKARDLWFIGYIPQMVAGVWLGNDNNQPTWGSSSTAAYAWHRFMAQAVEKMPVEKFPDIPKLEGRKGTIQAQAVKPKRIQIGKITEQNSTNASPRLAEGSENYSPSRRRRRIRRSYLQQQEAPPRRRRLRRNFSTPPTVNNGEPQKYDRLLQRLRLNRSTTPELFKRSPSPSPETPSQTQPRRDEGLGEG